MDDPRLSAPPPPRHIRPPQPPSRGTQAHSFPALLVSSMADQRPARRKAGKQLRERKEGGWRGREAAVETGLGENPVPQAAVGAEAWRKVP